MVAAYHGHPRLVELMLMHGADPNRLNDRGQSPLAGAVFKMEDAVVDVGHCLTFGEQLADVREWGQGLLSGGADPDCGKPSAMECIVMFNQVDKWKRKFEAARGRGDSSQGEFGVALDGGTYGDRFPPYLTWHRLCPLL